MQAQSFQTPETSENRHEPEQAGTLENNDNSGSEWLSVNDAQEHFRALGLPRSPEAIRKYCRQGKVEAEVIAGPKGDQHMIKRDSIDVFVAEQLKVLAAASRTVPVQDGSSRQIPVQSVTYRHEPEPPETGRNEQSLQETIDAQREQIERLEREKRDLKIDKEVRGRMNAMLEENNARLIEQLREASLDAQNWSHKAGRLEGKMEQLSLAGEVVEDRAMKSDAPDPFDHQDVSDDTVFAPSFRHKPVHYDYPE